MGIPIPQFTPPEGPQPSGWQASLRLGFEQRGGRTVLTERARQGPLAVQRPFYTDSGRCHVYLLHPPGGVVGGDELTIDVALAEHTQALLTTPGAGKFYRSAGPIARQRHCLRIASGAHLEWLPQENIYFPGADVMLDTRVELQQGARLALWDIHCLGRPAADEAFTQGRVDLRLSISRDGRPLLLDRLHLGPADLHGPAMLDGMPVFGSCVICPAGEAELARARAILAASQRLHCAATLLDDLLVIRYLGSSTEVARSLFTEIWQGLCETSATPRIWAT